MKIGEPQVFPYLPLPTDNPVLQQKEALDVDGQTSQQGIDHKNREIVAQQAGTHAHAQIRQDKFVDPSQTVQGQSRALLEQKPSVSKRGLKRSLANGFEQLDLSQGTLSTGFQRKPRDSSGQGNQQSGAFASRGDSSQYYLKQSTISQQSLSGGARKSSTRLSVEGVEQLAQQPITPTSKGEQASNVSVASAAELSPEETNRPNSSFEMARVQEAVQGF